MKPTLLEGIRAIYRRPDKFNEKVLGKNERPPPTYLQEMIEFMGNKVMSRKMLLTMPVSSPTIDRCISYMSKNKMIMKIPKIGSYQRTAMHYQVVKKTPHTKLAIR